MRKIRLNNDAKTQQYLVNNVSLVQTHFEALHSATLFGARVNLPLFSDGRAAECAVVHWPFWAESLLLHGNSLSALQSSQQFHDDISTFVHLLVSTQETNDTTPSGSALGHNCYGHINSPVLAGPIWNVTSEAMPTSLAEALTQLSFFEFLQRCNLIIAPIQPSQLPVPISPLDTTVQTTSPCDASQDASTKTSDQPVSSLSLDVAVQTTFHSVRTSSLHAAVQTIPHRTLSQNVSTQMGSRSTSSFSCGARCFHTTTAHGVLYSMYLLERSSGPPILRSSVPAISTSSTCLSAAAARTRTARHAS